MESAYDFGWHDYCDWYLEAIKPRLNEGDASAVSVANYVLDTLLKLLHPFMPFVTEELSSLMPGKNGYLMQSSWPADLSHYADSKANAEFGGHLIGTVNEIRAYRTSIAGAPAKGGAVKLQSDHGRDWDRVLAHLAKVTVVSELPPGRDFGLVEGSIVFPAIAAADRSVTAKKAADLKKTLEATERQLANPEFRANAPFDIVRKLEERAAEIRAAIDRLRD
jgi:valyl-tRNA synthetase